MNEERATPAESPVTKTLDEHASGTSRWRYTLPENSGVEFFDPTFSLKSFHTRMMVDGEVLLKQHGDCVEIFKGPITE